MNYSGRTTVLEHKNEKTWQDYKGPFAPSITEETVFHAQWSECPIEVYREVQKLWSDSELGNDYYYLGWESEEMGEDYPIIDEYLKSKNVTKCLIHYW